MLDSLIPSSAIIPALIIVFREVIEAGLIISIIMAATKNVAFRTYFIIGGIAAGILGACLVALFAGTIAAALSGSGQDVFNASILYIAVIMLAIHQIWMSSHGREMSREMKALGADVTKGSRSLIALAVVVAIAVLREGSEIVLFLYGIAISEHNTLLQMFMGGALGLVLGGIVSAGLYLGLLRIPLHYLFAFTGTLIMLLASGMAAQGTVFLEQAGIVTHFTKTLWNSSSLISSDSIAGKMLHALVGYTDRPDGSQIIAYLITLISIYSLTKIVKAKHHKPAPVQTMV